MKILIAEDDPTSRKMLTAILKKDGHEVMETANGVQAWEALQEPDAPRLLVLDWMMPEMDGLELCKRIRQMDMKQPFYIIMLTALGDKKYLYDGLNAGVDDYVGKPYEPAELRARVKAAQRLITLQENLIRAASIDSLTGLPNRANIIRTLAGELSRATRDVQSVGIALLDIDHFKNINDTFGHRSGDDALLIFATRCQAALRPYDSLGRYGGEEFLVVAPNCTPDDGPWERLRSVVAASPFKTKAGDIHVTVSIGVTYGDGSIDADKLLAAADKALYKAKENGRNQVCLTPSVSGPEVFSRPETESEKTERTAAPPSEGVDHHYSISAGSGDEKKRILIAEDDPTSRRILTAILNKKGYEILETSDGGEVWNEMLKADAPKLLILDWMLPVMDGLEVVQRVRALQASSPPYIIMLTTREEKKDIITGLAAGADDYLSKPFDTGELQARIEVGWRMVTIQERFVRQIEELSQARNHIKTLQDIIPICSFCKKIRNDKGYWDRLEAYFSQHSETRFSHGVCPECMKKHYSEAFEYDESV